MCDAFISPAQAAAQSAEVPAIQRAALLDALSESLDSGAVSLVLHTSVVLPVALRLYLKPKQEDVFDAIVRLFVRCVRLVPLDVLVKEVCLVLYLLGMHAVPIISATGPTVYPSKRERVVH